MERLKGERLIIRADASTQIGVGHLMRCLALAQAWKDASGEVTFITACQSEELLQRLREEEFDVHVLADSYPDPGDWDYTKDILAASPDAWVVLDGYHFDEVYQQWVKEVGHRLLVIDDMAHLRHYYADILLNQNLGAEQLHYSCEPYTRLLLGTRYVLLRKEFLAWRGWKREIPEVARRVLVTIGGSDPKNVTLKVIQALQAVDIADLEAIVVIGASNPHTDVLETAAKQSHIPIQLVHDARNMPELMSQADVAISGFGVTCWELAYMGVPILVVAQVPNQEVNTKALEGSGVALSLNMKNAPSSALSVLQDLLTNKQVRTAMSQMGRAFVDGQGVQRVIASVQEMRTHRLKLRVSTLDDCRLLWEWRNDPVTRATSFSSAPIPWEQHVRWFRTKLSDPNCHYYIVLDEKGLPVGQVRFDALDAEAEINVSLSSYCQGHGYGAEAIQLTSRQLFWERAITRIYAHIKQDNIASIRAFTKAGYRMAGIKVVKGHKALQMILDRNEEGFEGDPH